MNNRILNCTRCGKPFSDLRLQVTLYLHTDRLKENGLWEEIANLDQESTEYLCPDCFKKFCDIQSQMNIQDGYVENIKNREEV